ncbi:MAG: NAD(P)/FAD-dependent oxidoreductase [Candidatus Obscuribacterales bacterium]|nr:NAD(P)/FAD-dependent oxidoreductase [Candidatus Obscuribacterales bacterium]
MSNHAKAKPHVVIVGGGFGGLAAAQALKNAPVRITILDRTNYHLFQPLLYQVAMAGLSPGEIAHPIRSILRDQKNSEVLLAEVQDINLDGKKLTTTCGDISYDYLILSAGAKTNYYAHPEWATHAVGLKDIDDALEIRRRVLLAFEEAEQEHDTREHPGLLTFVVIGAGPTGVELAGSLAELARFALAKDFRHINPKSARVILLEGMPRVLPPFEENLSLKAAEQLKHMGVEVRTGVTVKNIDEEGVHLDSGEVIKTKTAIWCAGITPNSLVQKLGVPLDKGKRVVVEPDLSIPGHKEAFTIGDMSSFIHQGDKPLPGLAPVAIQQGQAAAACILADLKNKPRTSFIYKDRGTLATIGRSAAVADFGILKLSGFIAWLLWLFIHILFLIGFRNRLSVLINWLWSFLTYERGARLITGHRLEAGAPECAQDNK